MGEDVFTPNSLELFIELIVVELTLEEQLKYRILRDK
jgi:hypothetical protein